MAANLSLDPKLVERALELSGEKTRGQQLLVRWRNLSQDMSKRMWQISSES